MDVHASWIGWVIVGGASAAALSDLATRRIPNWLPVAILLAAVAYHAGHGASELVLSLGAAGTVVVLGTFAHARGWLGGGDVKLAAAVAAGFGVPGAAAFLLYALVSGGALALVSIAIAQRRTLGATTRSYAMVFAGGALPRMTGGSLQIPYAVAIACGAALAQCASTLPFLRLFS